MREGAVECRGTLVPLPPGHRNWLRLEFDGPDQAGAVDGAEVLVHYRDTVDPERIHRTPGTSTARVPLTRPEEPTAIRLPERPGVWAQFEETAA